MMEPNESRGGLVLYPGTPTMNAFGGRASIEIASAIADAPVFQTQEDYGIIMSEGLATGTSVGGLTDGCAVDTNEDGDTGRLAVERRTLWGSAL